MKPADLPISLHDRINLQSKPGPESEPEPQGALGEGSNAISVLYLLIILPSHMEHQVTQELLQRIGQAIGNDTISQFIHISVPSSTPSSEAQAKEWSAKYWPCSYMRQNPFGPHPAIVAEAATEAATKVDEYMNFAQETARQAMQASIGKEVAAVVINRTISGSSSIVMVAGDARCCQISDLERHDIDNGGTNGNGNAMAHAVMRVIGLIARKRREVATHSQDSESIPGTTAQEDSFHDVPLTEIERSTYQHSPIQPGGYLCLNYEFYLTHEPCVMCSMAIVHSRAGRVIFGKRMLQTGGLAVEIDPQEENNSVGAYVRNSPAYGIFWHPSLNWKFLTWQWMEDGASPNTKELWHA